VSGWEIAWIVAGCLAYLWVGAGLQAVLFMDEPPSPQWTAPFQRLGIVLLWLPGAILLGVARLFFFA
jgi:hypothetical protein